MVFFWAVLLTGFFGKRYNFSMIKQYALYLFRWQLSTPIMALCLHFLNNLDSFWATVIANLIGGLIFFWIDRLIFSKNGSEKTKAATPQD